MASAGPRLGCPQSESPQSESLVNIAPISPPVRSSLNVQCNQMASPLQFRPDQSVLGSSNQLTACAASIDAPQSPIAVDLQTSRPHQSKLCLASLVSTAYCRPLPREIRSRCYQHRRHLLGRRLSLVDSFQSFSSSHHQCTIIMRRCFWPEHTDQPDLDADVSGGKEQMYFWVLTN